MTSASELRDAFAKFDANGDGYLSVEELVGVFTRPVGDGQPMTEADAERSSRRMTRMATENSISTSLPPLGVIRQERADKGKSFGRTSYAAHEGDVVGALYSPQYTCTKVRRPAAHRNLQVARAC